MQINWDDVKKVKQRTTESGVGGENEWTRGERAAEKQTTGRGLGYDAMLQAVMWSRRVGIASQGCGERTGGKLRREA
jgi:hypothetical protein